MNIKSIIFDWDGTLGMSLHLWLDAYRNALGNQGQTHSDAFITTELFYEHDVGQSKHAHIDFSTMVKDAHAYLHAHLPQLVLYTRAKETLAGLAAKNINLTLVTSSPHTAVERGMAVHHLQPVFSSLIAGDHGFGHKPDPAPFVETMKRIDATPQETLIIGDARTDILAGKAAGTRTCIFKPPENRLFHDFDALERVGADFNIQSLGELLDLI